MLSTDAALIIQIGADIRSLRKEMQNALGISGTTARGIERRNKQMVANLNSQMSKIGRFALGTAAFYSIGRMVSSVVNYADKIQNAADATKQSTDFIQAYGVMAKRAGIDQESLNGALVKFNKNVGAAQRGGGSKKLFDAIGVDVSGSPEEVFYRVADAVAAASTAQQKGTIVATAFGKGSGNLVPILERGSVALRAQVEELKRLGYVLDKDGIKKLDELGDAWEDLKKQLMVKVVAPAVIGFLDSIKIKEFSGEIGSSQFKDNMRVFGERLGEIAGWVAKIAPYLPNIAGAWAGGKIPGPPIIKAIGAGIGALAPELFSGKPDQRTRAQLLATIGDMLKAKRAGVLSYGGEQELARAQAALDKLAKAPDYGDSGVVGQPKPPDYSGALSAEADAKAAEQFAAKLRNMDKARAKEVRLFIGEESGARRDAIMAQDEALLQLIQGTSDYFDFQKLVIEEVARLDIQSIDERRAAELDAIEDMEDMHFSAAATEAERTKIKADFAMMRTAIENAAASQEVAINARKNADLKQTDEDYYHTKQNLIAINDELRQGLTDIGAAGVHGFKSMKDAVASFLDTLAQMIIQLYIMEPLVRSLLGAKGTTGGGIIGSAISSIGDWLGFAGGGVMTSRGPLSLRKYAGGGIARTRQIAEFGEGSVPEAFVPVPSGRIPVELRMPSIPQIRSNGPQNLTLRSEFKLYVYGTGDKELMEQMHTGMQFVVAQYDRTLPDRVKGIANDPRRR